MFDVAAPRRPTAGRLAGATAALAVAGAALALLAPDPVRSARALPALQTLADTAGADAVVLRVAGLLGWLAWGWGALGLALTVAAALPGAAGALARGLLRIAVPATARRLVAVALGLGLGLDGAVGAIGGDTALAAVSSTSPPSVPDWPSTGPVTPAPPSTRTPDRAATHVVARGECLWRIAAADLDRGTGPASDAQVATAVHAWWTANETVIGPDPDLLLPGQVLHAPAPGSAR